MGTSTDSQGKSSIEQALRDVADIRRAVELAQRADSRQRRSGITRLHRNLHIVLVSLAAAWLIREVAFQHTATNLLYYSHFADYEFRIVIAALAGAILFLLCGALYFAVWRAAQRAGEELGSYIHRNFLYLRAVSFSSDLFSKFIAVTVVILAGRGDWVAPLLLICTGDYLLQGRLFVLPVRLALLLGLGCFIFGLAQLFWLSGSLSYPLAAFLLVSIMSLLNIVRLERHAAESEKAATADML